MFIAHLFILPAESYYYLWCCFGLISLLSGLLYPIFQHGFRFCLFNTLFIPTAIQLKISIETFSSHQMSQCVVCFKQPQVSAYLTLKSQTSEKWVDVSLPSSLRSGLHDLLVGLRPSTSALTVHVASRPPSTRLGRRRGALLWCLLWRVRGVTLMDLPALSRVWPPRASPARDELWIGVERYVYSSPTVRYRMFGSVRDFSQFNMLRDLNNYCQNSWVMKL